MTASKSDWMFCQLLDCGGAVFPREPFQVGHFEISGRLEPFPEGEAALVRSIGGYRLDAQRGYGRIRTVLVDADERQAKREGRLHVREAVTLLRHAYPFIDGIRILDAGYVMNLQTLQASPLIPSPMQAIGGTMFLFDDRAQNPGFTLNRVLRLGDASGELGRALRRSAHWSDLAERIDDVGERFLMKWMAVECLCRVGVDEVINGKVCAAVPLPTSDYFRQLPPTDQAALLADPRFKIWTKRAATLVDRLRIARNDVAHSGYRELDLRDSMSEDEVRTSLRLMNHAVGGAQSLALKALVLGYSTVSELWANYGRCLVFSRHAPVATEVFGTVIFTLQNPQLLPDEP